MVVLKTWSVFFTCQYLSCRSIFHSWLESRLLQSLSFRMPVKVFVTSIKSPKVRGLAVFKHADCSTALNMFWITFHRLCCWLFYEVSTHCLLWSYSGSVLSCRFGLSDLRFWRGSPRPRSTSAEPTEAPCAPRVCVTGKRGVSLHFLTFWQETRMVLIFTLFKIVTACLLLLLLISYLNFSSKTWKRE